MRMICAAYWSKSSMPTISPYFRKRIQAENDHQDYTGSIEYNAHKNNYNNETEPLDQAQAVAMAPEKQQDVHTYEANRVVLVNSCGNNIWINII